VLFKTKHFHEILSRDDSDSALPELCNCQTVAALTDGRWREKPFSFPFKIFKKLVGT